MKGTGPPPTKFLPVHVRQDDVHGADDGDEVGEQPPGGQLVGGVQHHEGRRPDLDPEGLGRAVADQEKAQFAFGGLDGLVDLALGRDDAFLDNLEVVDERGDVGVDLFLGRQAHPGVVHLDVAGRQLFQGLAQDAVALEHLLHAHQVPGVSVACFGSQGHVEIKVFVTGIRVVPAQVPIHPGAPGHGAGPAPIQGLVRAHDADADGALFPDDVFGEQVVVILPFVREFPDKLHGLGDKAVGEIRGQAADAAVQGKHAGAGDHFAEVHDLFPLPEAIEQRGHGPEIVTAGAHPEDVGGDAGEFGHDHPDILGPFRHLDA